MIRRYINLSLNIVATVAMLTAFLPMLSWSRLEGVPVPSHFDIHGAVDKVGGREILLTLALVGLGVYIVMMLAQRYPQMVNLRLLPRKETIADIRSGRVLRPRRRSDNPVVNSAKRDLAAQLNLLICLIFSFGANSTFSVAAGKIQTLNVWFIWAILALMLICIGVALFRIYRR